MRDSCRERCTFSGRAREGSLARVDSMSGTRERGEVAFVIELSPWYTYGVRAQVQGRWTAPLAAETRGDPVVPRGRRAGWCGCPVRGVPRFGEAS